MVFCKEVFISLKIYADVTGKWENINTVENIRHWGHNWVKTFNTFFLLKNIRSPTTLTMPLLLFHS